MLQLTNAVVNFLKREDGPLQSNTRSCWLLIIVVCLWRDQPRLAKHPSTSARLAPPSARRRGLLGPRYEC